MCVQQLKVLLVQRCPSLTWREITSILRIRPVMDVLCWKDTKVYTYSMYENVYASELSDNTLRVSLQGIAVAVWKSTVLQPALFCGLMMDLSVRVM